MKSLNFDVFIIEDDVLQQLSLSEACENLGYKTLCAATAEAALNYLPHLTNKHMVFCDMELGEGLSGIDVGKLIIDKYPTITLVGMSSDIEYKEKALKAGFALFIEKPIKKGFLKSIFSLKENLSKIFC